MRKRWVTWVLIACCTGCAGAQQSCSHMKSTFVGLPRIVSLYSPDGTLLKKWQGNYNVEITGNTARFIDHGKTITISGTWIVEEQ